jgi:hypothetical protein
MEFVTAWPATAPLPEFFSQMRQVRMLGNRAGFTASDPNRPVLAAGLYLIRFPFVGAASSDAQENGSFHVRIGTTFSTRRSIPLVARPGEPATVLLNAPQPVGGLGLDSGSGTVEPLRATAEIVRLGDPLGQLDDSDLCVHQLEGQPEILTFAKLRSGRRKPELMTIREPESVIRIAICGDLMLGRDIAAQADPLGHIAPMLQRADLALGNLECVIGTAQPKSRLQLIAPPKTAAILREAGLDGLSLENNHALDLGPEGHAATKQALQAENIASIGHEAKIFEIRGKRIAVLALDDSREDAVLPEITVKADFVIALPHWGREHRTTPSTRQREVAARLLQNGVHLIAGSGPHALQPLEHHFGGSVAFSLGNTVFDGPGPDAEWDRGGVLEITLDAKDCRLVRARVLETSSQPEK